MSETMRRSGGCQCGAVRYAIHEAPFQNVVCHCRMCQKAYGGPFSATFTVNKDKLEWTRGAPAFFASSAKMQRGFCRDCGTPLYMNWATAKVIHLSICSLDAPRDVRPELQTGIESRVPWFFDLAGLPESETKDAFKGYEDLAEEIVHTNHQHPDHDTAVWPPVEVTP
jgi:hypothetical protein